MRHSLKLHGNNEKIEKKKAFLPSDIPWISLHICIFFRHVENFLEGLKVCLVGKELTLLIFWQQNWAFRTVNWLKIIETKMLRSSPILCSVCDDHRSRGVSIFSNEFLSWEQRNSIDLVHVFANGAFYGRTKHVQNYLRVRNDTKVFLDVKIQDILGNFPQRLIRKQALLIKYQSESCQYSHQTKDKACKNKTSWSSFTEVPHRC